MMTRFSPTMSVRRVLLLPAVALALATVLSACVVAPAPPPPRYAPPPPPPPPAGVVYVAPSYAMPAPGYVWAYHPQFGWGWHHPRDGWHRGWR